MGGTATPVTWAPKPRGTPPLLGSQVVNHGFTFPGPSFTDRACGEGKRDKTRNIPERGWGWGPLHCRVPLKQTQATSPRQSRAGKAEKQGKERTGAGKEGSDAQTGSEGAPGGASQNGGRPLPSGVTPNPCSRPAKPLSSSDAPARPGSDRYAFPPRPLRRFASSFRTTSAPPSAASALEFGTRRTEILTGSAGLRRQYNEERKQEHHWPLSGPLFQSLLTKTPTGLS